MFDKVDHIRGIFPALLTPFTEDGQIDEKTLARIVQWHIKLGVAGFYVGGSTGESLLLSMEERKYVTEIVTETARGKAKVIAQIGNFATRHAIELAEHAASAGADMISSVPPSYYNFTPDEIVSYYTDIVTYVPLPMIVYNVPAFTGVKLSNDHISRLFHNERIVGLKHTSYNLFQLERIMSTHPKKLILNGHDEMFLPALSIGVQGAIGSTFNFLAQPFISLQRYFEEGNLEKALQIQKSVNEMIALLLQIGIFPAIKAAMEIIGFPVGACRRPLKQITKEERRRLELALKDIL